MEVQLACPHNIPKKPLGPGIAKPTQLQKKTNNMLSQKLKLNIILYFCYEKFPFFKHFLKKEWRLVIIGPTSPKIKIN
jgi:hypothetical protein